MSIFRNLKVEPDFEMDKRDKHKVKFVRMVSGFPDVIKTKKIKKFVTHVTLRDNTFAIDFNKPSYREKNTFFYLFDVSKGQMFFTPSDFGGPKGLTYLILRRNIIRQIVSGVEKKKLGEVLIYILLAVASAIPIGYILGNILPMG